MGANTVNIHHRRKHKNIYTREIGDREDKHNGMPKTEENITLNVKRMCQEAVIYHYNSHVTCRN